MFSHLESDIIGVEFLLCHLLIVELLQGNSWSELGVGNSGLPFELTRSSIILTTL